jgi:hypothetical protein
MARKKIERAVRDGRPFNLKKLSEDAELVALALNCAPEPEDRLNKPLNEYLNLVLNQQLRKKKFEDKIYKRYDRATGKIERAVGTVAFVLYPSNDRDRFHLRESEVFIPARIQKNDKRWKEYAEPPLIIKNNGTPAPTEEVTTTLADAPPIPAAAVKVMLEDAYLAGQDSVNVPQGFETAPAEAQRPFVPPMTTKAEEIGQLVSLIYTNIEKVSFSCSLINSALIEQMKLVERLANIKED